MKKILSVLLTLTLVLTVFVFSSGNVQAEATSTCTTDHTLFVHYHRWDGTYTDTTIWAWGYGTNGSGAGAGVKEVDEFGAVYEICIDSTDAASEVGLINKYSAAWGDNFTDRDAVDTDENGSKDGNHKNIVIRDENGDLVGFDENGVKHVYVFEGSNQVNYTTDANSLPYSDDLATIAIVYYDTAESYDGWNIWTWGTGTNGSQVGDVYAGSGIPFASGLGVDGGTVENFRVSFINVDPTDMGSEIGFIMRTDSWEKKNPDVDGDGEADNIMISTEGLQAGDFKTLFYISGEEMMRETFADFEATVNLFEIESAKALDPGSIEVIFNKEVILKEDDVVIFDPANFVVKDKDGQVVAISQVSYNSTVLAATTFAIILDDTLSGPKAPYTVEYTYADGVATKSFEVDTKAPEIFLIGSDTRTLELGKDYTLPSFSARDEVDGETVEIYNVKVKDGSGLVDTSKVGTYEVVIIAEDDFGNVAEKVITVTVVDPCETDADANNYVELAALLAGLPLALGAIVTLRRGL